MQAQVPFTCKGQYFLSLTKSGSKSSELYRVKINQDGTTISLDTINKDLGLVLNAMGYRITDNLIYGLDPIENRLRRVGADGVIYDLGVPKGIPPDPTYYAGDVSPDGRFLLTIGVGGGPSSIVKIDLTDPEYSCTFIPIKANTAIVDIAFDPFSGVLYGHDFQNDRLVILDPNTGDVNSNFTRQPQVDQLGALFFDSFGNLYGYGAYGSFQQNKFVGINKFTGEMSLLAQGPISSGQDGCACPYTMQLQKIVTPDTTYECTEVVYSFVVSNGSGATRTGISLIDTMPSNLKALKILKNPFNSTGNLSGNILNLTDMVVPAGIDTIQVLVEVGKGRRGEFKNQAILKGLPISLGATTLSDDPFTFVEQDSTSLWVLPTDFETLEDSLNLCYGDSIFYQPIWDQYTYRWGDGDTSRGKWLVAPGEYSLTITNICEQTPLNISVFGDAASVNIEIDTLIIDLGDTIPLTSTYYSKVDVMSFDWQGFKNVYFSCNDCQDTDVASWNDGSIILTMENIDGCKAIDSVYIRVEKNRSLYAPNIFSPNSDGNNDFFNLFGNDKAVTAVNIRIYDRWGNLVYVGSPRLNDRIMGWDGNFLGRDAATGVYAWTAEVTYIDGESVFLKGDVTLIR
jgi:gliding motility-associated-like protein